MDKLSRDEIMSLHKDMDSHPCIAGIFRDLIYTHKIAQLPPDDDWPHWAEVIKISFSSGEREKSISEISRFITKKLEPGDPVFVFYDNHVLTAVFRKINELGLAQVTIEGVDTTLDRKLVAPFNVKKIGKSWDDL